MKIAPLQRVGIINGPQILLLTSSSGNGTLGPRHDHVLGTLHKPSFITERIVAHGPSFLFFPPLTSRPSCLVQCQRCFQLSSSLGLDNDDNLFHHDSPIYARFTPPARHHQPTAAPTLTIFTYKTKKAVTVAATGSWYQVAANVHNLFRERHS